MLTWALVAAAAQAGAPVSRASDALDQIIVTGERVTRSPKQTQSSLSLVTQREIEATGADRVDQMLALVPNVQLGSRSEGPAIRGLDTTGALQALPAFLGGNRPRTTLIVDGRPQNYSEFVFGAAPVWDVERIEVFRSPQTTTQGVNSIAGAIFVVSNDPTFDREIRARAIGGDYRMREISALASGPLSQSVALRVAGDLRYSRTTSKIAPEMAGADPDHEAYGLLRTKLLLQPHGGSGRLLLTYVHSQSQSPQSAGVKAPFEDRRDPNPGYGIFRVTTDSVTATARQQLADGLTANLLLTGGSSRARRFAIPGFGEARNRGHDWSGEAVLNWKTSGPVAALAGVSHTHVSLHQAIDLSLLSGLTGNFGDWQDGSGLFGEGSVVPLAKLTLTAGLRYQQDRQRRVGALTTTAFAVPIDFVGTFHAWLPKLSVAYDVTPQLRAGILVQKAYNPGGTTIRFDTANPDNFRAESLWDYEVFARGASVDGRMQFSANVFTYEMRNAQRAEPITIFTPTGKQVGFANLFNVPRARSSGAELSAKMQANARFSAQVAVGLLDTRITRTDAESAPFNGKQFDRAPHFTGSIAIDWKPMRAFGLSAQVRHHSSYFTDNANSPALQIAPATIVDMRLEHQLKRALLFVQLRNLFNRFALIDQTTLTSGEAEDPRRVMIGVDARF